MVICKNAAEYMQIFNNLMADAFQDLHKRNSHINKKFQKSLDNASGPEWRTIYKKYEKALKNATHESIKPMLDFEKSQPEKPIFVFKANKKYYRLKIDWATAEYTKLKRPIPDIRLLRWHKPGWIVTYTYSHAFDFVICPNCQREFTRIYPHETYCPVCRRSPRLKKTLIDEPEIRYCQNPGCEKLIPRGKNRRSKYCCGACRTAACMKRKK